MIQAVIQVYLKKKREIDVNNVPNTKKKTKLPLNNLLFIVQA